MGKTEFSVSGGWDELECESGAVRYPPREPRNPQGNDVRSGTAWGRGFVSTGEAEQRRNR